MRSTHDSAETGRHRATTGAGKLGRIALVVFGVLALWAPSALASSGPAVVGSVSNNSSLSEADSVAVSGNYAYTTAYENGTLTAVDISNPAAPVVAGTSAVASSLYGGATVNVAGGYAYVASKNRNASSTSNDNGDGNSLTVLDIHTNPAVPVIVGTLHDPANLFGAYGVAVSGDYAYVAAQGELSGEPQVPDTSKGSFSVVDVSDPTAPKLVGHLDNGSLPAPWAGTNALEHAAAVFVSGNYAYVTAAYSNRLTIIDISNPASPTIVSSPQDNVNLAFPVDVAVSGNYAYVADQTATGTASNFTVVDVSNPAAPQVVGSIIGQGALLAGAYRLRVVGGFAYVAAANTDTVSAIDISNPASPRVVASVKSSASLHIPIGLDFDPAGGYIITSSAFAVGDPNPTYPPYTPNLTTGTIADIQLDSSPITVTIAPGSEPPAVTAQTSASFTLAAGIDPGLAASDQIATVQCKLDGAPLGSCTSPTTQSYSALAVGSHTFTVQATDALGNTSSASYTWAVETPPVNSARPVISGTDAVGQTLSCSQGTWTGSAPISYTHGWTRGGAAIAGATRTTYVIASADAKHVLACSVHAANAVGSATAASASLPAPAGSGSAGRPKLLSGGALSVKVTCASVAGTVCHLKLTIAVTESLNGKKLIAVTAAKKATKVVVFASRSITLSAGKHQTVKLSLDGAGKKLLTKRRKLPVSLALAEAGSNGQSTTVSARKLTFRAARLG